MSDEYDTTWKVGMGIAGAYALFTLFFVGVAIVGGYNKFRECNLRIKTENLNVNQKNNLEEAISREDSYFDYSSKNSNSSKIIREEAYRPLKDKSVSPTINFVPRALDLDRDGQFDKENYDYDF